MKARLRAAFDTCVLLNVFTEGGADPLHYLPLGTSLLERVRSGEIEGLVPAVVVTELVANVRVRAMSPVERSAHVRRVSDGLVSLGALVVDIDRRAAEAAAKYATDHGLRLADALVLGCAVVGRADVLYSWDPDLTALTSVDGVAIAEPPKPEQQTLDLSHVLSPTP